VGLLLVALLPVAVLFIADRRQAHWREAVESGRAVVLTGRVEGFHPMEPGCHDDEHFVVAKHRFAYRDCAVTGAFNRSSTYGGPVRPGQLVRITHVEGAIIKLEISDNPPVGSDLK
jgi:hypothetical protein